MKQQRRWHQGELTLGGLLGAMAILAACSGPPASPSARASSVSGVEVETVRSEMVSDEVAAPGTVTAARTAQVTSRVMGTVERVAVREGDHVRQGQLLIALDDREFAARRKAAEEGLTEARAARDTASQAIVAAEAEAEVAGKTYRRYEFLHEQKSVSLQEFDEVRAKERAVKAALEQARAGGRETQAAQARAAQEFEAATAVASYARIVAPFDGVVLRRYVDAGSTAGVGMPLVTVEDAAKYRLEATLDARDASSVHRGTHARIRLDALAEKEFEGTVAELEAGAEPTSHTVRVKVDLPSDPALRSGLFGRPSPSSSAPKRIDTK